MIDMVWFPHREQLLAALKELKQAANERKVPAPEVGICFNINHMSLGPLGCDRLLKNLSCTWENFSGDVDYPIPGGEFAFMNNYDLWGGEQLVWRMMLLNHLIEQLELGINIANKILTEIDEHEDNPTNSEVRDDEAHY